MKGFYDKVSQILQELAINDYGLELEHPLWELPKSKEHGDLSSMVALKIASQIKKDPLAIASEIKTRLEEKLSGWVQSIEILRPGFINLFLSRDILINSLNEIISGGDKFFRSQLDKKVLIEFLSANPTGPLSIAHGRQAVVGDCLANVLEFFGNAVSREYYVNNAGRQIELLVLSVKAWLGAKKGKRPEIPEGGYQGEYLKDIAGFISANKDYRKDPQKFDLEKFVIKYILDEFIKKDLKALGIKFDNWFSQKKLLAAGKVEAMIDYLKEKGLVFEKDGALWFLASRFGDDKDRVIRKADGELTYFASDIAYHHDKIKRGSSELINLWGPDHHGYIQRVKSAISALGYDQSLLKVIIIQLVTLKTKERMSKRAGTFILLSDLVKDIGKDAARFYYLMRKNSSHLEFDIDLAKATSFDNPLYYIQYVCARIESIFKKAKALPFDPKYSLLLKDQEELNLLRSLLQFSYCLEKSYYTLEPVFIIEFLKNLAANFHKFYEKVRVIDDDQNITQSRLNLLRAVRIVFHCGLILLGITPAKKM
ncbi:MAG: arginine--tRNA ligase [Candidatus Omnitrophica bacterium]|nr:arginine--tRNA ligase [Candidatus Omnitrophota bacterium]